MQPAHKEERLNPNIERKVELIESGKIKGKIYTPDEYLKHVDETKKIEFCGLYNQLTTLLTRN